MVHYEPVHMIITVPTLVEIILNVVVWYHDLPDLIISNRG